MCCLEYIFNINLFEVRDVNDNLSKYYNKDLWNGLFNKLVFEWVGTYWIIVNVKWILFIIKCIRYTS